ncbi:hypothetical protein [Hyalangium sp.]|uniref:hypothetical protein n=1 Tax=Hyalangium sp. TaxID=2028555 RepID=UPI002D397AC5|nr:hypothetical protein [Hyalangium sp.]HYH98599.1 hypothetical protein [Hyalangium sp.]
MALELLLAHADGCRPVLQRGLAEGTLRSAPRPEPLEPPEILWDASGDPHLLPRQRWGLIAPQGPEGDRLLALVELLKRRREEEQGAPARVYRVPRGLDGPAAARWKKRVFRSKDVPDSERPRYLLLLGDLDQVPLELQQVLSSDAFVGRLAFPTAEGYEAYVTKVLRWEDTPSREPRARLLFFSSRDGTSATELGHRGLIQPSLAACRERQQVGGFPKAELTELAGEGSTPAAQLLAQAAEPRPSVLFSLSHGLGPPREGWDSPARQRELQGALVLPGGQSLTGAELASRPFLPGGIWFCFACYSAGTPAQSTYAHWLSQLPPGVDLDATRVLASVLRREVERPFIAALPQAVLANPEGPLAVMGHVDLAWAWSYLDQGRDTSSHFFGLLHALAEGRRAGVALSTLLRFLIETSIELTTLYDQEAKALRAGSPSPVDPVARAYLWMLRQDLAGYILLGDPAVRLPLASARVEASVPRSHLDAMASVGLAGFELPAPPAPEPTAAEQAVIELLAGKGTLADIAARHGIAPGELCQWEELYRAAGRAALARHLSQRE